jgi:hypothetical protein
MGFSSDFLVTTDVTAEKRSQTQGNLHQWFRMHRPTGITHIPIGTIQILRSCNNLKHKTTDMNRKLMKEVGLKE